LKSGSASVAARNLSGSLLSISPII
jgi:hypothetical protein